jgi:uncharacterized protein (UPF0332 family)
MDRNIELAILKSEDFLETGKDDLKANHISATVNRCYYAYFWLAKTLLFKKDIFVKTHNGVKSKFSELYIKTEIIPEIYGKHLAKLMDYRQEADYDLESNFSEEEVQEMIAWTEEFLAFVKKNIDKL